MSETDKQLVKERITIKTSTDEDGFAQAEATLNADGSDLGALRYSSGGGYDEIRRVPYAGIAERLDVMADRDDDADDDAYSALFSLLEDACEEAHAANEFGDAERSLASDLY